LAAGELTAMGRQSMIAAPCFIPETLVFMLAGTYGKGVTSGGNVIRRPEIG